jgi:OOP family OmpA-OmpF porin
MGQDMMKKLADIGQCGIATTDTDLADDTKMATFIDSVFLAKAAPKPVAVVVKPAPVLKAVPLLDSDGDGVFDNLDKCPGTPSGVSVDTDGCPSKLTLHINFGFDSSQVDSKYDSELARAAQCINEYPGNSVFIDGHTDSSGPAAYNQVLSEQRAAAVKNRLIDKFNIAESRMVTRGFGEDRPVAGNQTAAERALNRRVDIACGTTK